MSQLLSRPPYSRRNDDLFLQEMNALTRHHRDGCAEWRRFFPDWKGSQKIQNLPFLHVGLFKRMPLKTVAGGIKHGRTVFSSATTGASSQIVLDQRSSVFQSRSTHKIFVDFIGEKKRPLLVLDSSESLRQRGNLSAQTAAAMSLQSLSSEIYFLLERPQEPDSLKRDFLAEFLKENDDFIVYGFSWILWLTFGQKEPLKEIAGLMKGKRITFIHSGGWKKLEARRIARDHFNRSLLGDLDPSSHVFDYYGLVEQLGIVYPLCEYEARHVPVWADVLVRDSYTLRPLESKIGQLQLLNTLAYGAPYHNVLTEDLGLLIPGPCRCGRSGKRFRLEGRIPKADLRGCANV